MAKKMTLRRLLSLITTSAMLLSLLSITANAESTTVDQISISSAEELTALFAADFSTVSDAHIVLTQDIDMSGTAAVAPLGMNSDGTIIAFTGTFDGQGHAIRNLTVNATTNDEDVVDCTGFFGYVGEEATITHLGLNNITVSGNRNVGGLAGCLTGSIEACYVTGTISGVSKVGGMAGILHGASVNNCWLDVSVTASGNTVGGLFGDANFNLRGPKADGSPLIARSTAAMNVTNTLILGSVSGKGKVGGMLGDLGNSLTSPLGSFDGNAVWVSSIAYTNDNYVGPVCGWWSDANYLDAAGNQNFYCSDLMINGANASFSDTHVNIFAPATGSILGLQATYENKSTGLGWDFVNTWVWSHELGHPILRNVTVPAIGDPLEQKTPASLITTFVDSPKTSRAFTWYTDSNISETVVQAIPAEHYVADNADVFFSKTAITVHGTCSSLQIDAYGGLRNIHKANLTGLQPGTTYYYRAGGNGHWSDVFSFRTESELDETFTFFSMTDTQASGLTNFTNYKNYVKVLDNATQRYPEGAFILQGGDVIQNNYLAHYDKVYELTQAYSATLPIMLTPGNHELGKNSLGYVNGLDNLNAHYQFPSNGPEGCSGTVYSFDYGNAHFAILDSNKTVSYAKQIEWLKEDMAATDKTWKIVSIHVGPYNNYGRGNQSLIDAIDELDIDLVFFGHNHTFLRSNPIKDGGTDPSVVGYDFLDSEGTVYYSSGCAGGSAGRGGGKDDQATSVEKMAKTYFSVLNYDAARGPLYGAVTVTFDTLTVSTYALSDDKLVDEFVITSPSVKAPVANELTYNGEEQELVVAGAVTNGTMEYSLDGVNYSESIPVATDADTYTVWYRTHLSIEPGKIIVTIDPLNIEDAEVVLGPSPAYNGEEQTQTVESVAVNGLSATFVVSGNTATEVGAYTLTITGSGNFCGTILADWELVERIPADHPDREDDDRPKPVRDGDRDPRDNPGFDRDSKERPDRDDNGEHKSPHGRNKKGEKPSRERIPKGKFGNKDNFNPSPRAKT